MTKPPSPTSHDLPASGASDGAETIGPAPRLALVLPRETGGTPARREEPPWLMISDEGIPAGCDYVYAPDNVDWRLGGHALSNALLSLCTLDLDFVIVSSSLTEPPAIEINSVRNNVIFSRRAFHGLRTQGHLPAGSRGRVLRILPGPRDAWAIRLADPNHLEIGTMRIQGADLHVPEDKSRYSRPPSTWNEPPHFRSPGDSRRRVLVLPIFMAVGGAERNLIQLLKALKDRFAFFVATTEPVALERGSLNHEAIQHCEHLFDLGEIASSAEHMNLIDVLAKAIEPDLVFIANGSPWLAAHAERLRRRFSDIPIVDQQVYDAREGWIQHFDNPGIRSADRFIAINREIAGALETRWAIDSDRIDLIYHAVDTECFNLDRRNKIDTKKTWARLGFGGPPPSEREEAAPRHVFGQVARLTTQKRPRDFLELAQRSAATGSRDLFLLIGDGELSADCDDFIDQHGLENVKRLPFCDDMSELYPILSGLIFTSAYEGLPVALLEALCMGVPVLSTAVGDIRPILDEFGTGQTVEAGASMEELFDAFTSWRDDLAWLQESARRAAPLVMERFNGTAVGARYARSWERAWKPLAPYRKTKAT